MHPLIEDNRDQLIELCKQHHVRRLDVFGSAAGDLFDPRTSDVDFVVEFEPMPPLEHGAAYWTLREALARVLGRPVDLIERQTIQNSYLQAEVQRSRVQLYDAA